MTRVEKQHKTKLTKGQKRAVREKMHKERAEAAALVQHDYATREKTKKQKRKEKEQENKEKNTSKKKDKNKNKDKKENEEDTTEPKATTARSTTAIPPPVIPASPEKHACANKASFGTAAVMVKPEISAVAAATTGAPVATTIPSVRPYRGAAAARPVMLEDSSSAGVSFFQSVGGQVTKPSPAESLVAQHVAYLRSHGVADLLSLVTRSIAVAEHEARK